MKIPHAEHTVIEMQKLVDYCLDPHHPRGKHKARVFLSSCGLTAKLADELRAALLHAAQSLDAELGEQDDYGQRYVIDLEVVGPAGSAQVRSVWIVRKGEDFPRFVSCYVL